MPVGGRQGDFGQGDGFGGQVERLPEGSAPGIVAPDVAYDVGAPREAADGLGYVGRGDAVAGEQVGGVADFEVAARGSGHVDRRHSFRPPQGGGDGRLGVFGNLVFGEAGVDVVGEQYGRLVLAAVVVDHLAARERGVAHTFGQAGIDLPQQRGYLEANGRDGSRLLQLDPDAAVAEEGLRGDALHALHPGSYPLDEGSDAVLHHLRRHAGPVEVDREGRSLPRRGSDPHVEQGDERRTDDHEDDHGQADGEVGGGFHFLIGRVCGGR